MFEFKFPDVGEGITEGKLVRWIVKEGDLIKKEQAVAEVETDKAVVEIPSPVTGKVTKLLYSEHDTIYVHKPMMMIDDGSTNFSAPEIKQSLKPLASQMPSIQPMPAAVKYYDTPARSQAPVSVPQNATITAQIPARRIMESQQNSIQLESKEIKAIPAARKLAKERNIDLAKINGTGPFGIITLKDIDAGYRTAVAKTALAYSSGIAPSPNTVQTIRNIQDVLATPSTRQLARELGVDITAIKGTGDHGMITKDDVKNAKNTPAVASQVPAASLASQTSQVNIQPMPEQMLQSNSESVLPQTFQYSPSADDTIIPVSGIRQAIFRKMSESWNNAVHVTISDEADVTELVGIRERLKAPYEAKGIKLTYLPFFVKATVLSLQRNPKLNATFDANTNSIIQKHYYNIGIAVDTEQGLMVPVIKNCEARNILQIATSIIDLAARARSRTIQINEMQQGTFTITSVGSIMGQVFTQIINYPESAILGIGRIIDKPVVINGQIAIRKMVTLSCTIDHRTIDGADASRFLMTLITYLQNPDSMMMEMI